MKKSFIIILTIILVSIFHFEGFAQEKYGNTLNIGLGIGGYGGYYRHSGHALPVININYEFDAARNFTLAPFISFATYGRNDRYNNNNYYNRTTVIPVGVKGTYYFDELFQADSKWDFYGAGSLGFGLINTRWDSGYSGDRNRGYTGLFLDLHIGAEYHFTSRIGGFLDLSTGVSTVGIAFH